jgi:hypothetical protein
VNSRCFFSSSPHPAAESGTALRRAYLYKDRSRIAVSRIDELSSGFGTFTNLMKARSFPEGFNGKSLKIRC